MIKSSQIRFFFIINLLLLNLSQIVYSIPINRNRGWVFWYYSNNGQTKDCANYCILTFAIVGGIMLLLILCGILSCYRIKRQASKDGYPSFKSYSFFVKEMNNEANEKGENEKSEKNKSKKIERSESMSEVLPSKNRK
ncbi:hypothetical protein GLOIN_2v1603025 [Rhizophagus clarus]|nr:hypothetical protein GLOIN_2v1603025 [Rhizophagus clarus]